MNSIVSEVYSEALFDLGKENNSLDSKQKDLVYIKRILDENEDLRKLLQNPNVQKSDKKEVVDTIFAGVDRESLNFVKVLIDKSRFNYINDIFDGFFKRYDKENNIARGVLTSARPMPEEDLKTIKVALTKKLDKKVELDVDVDPSLMGGFSIKIDGKLIDNSLKNRLLDLKSSLKERGELWI